MTISSEVSRNDYVGNGATSVYPYTFRIIASSDLLVTWADTAGVETILTLDVDYTVSGVGSGGGGNVTLTGGNLTSGYALTIRRVRPLTQETDVRNQGAFYPETHEDAFDHQIMVSQQLDDSMERALKLPETEAGTSASTTIPGADSRANMVLGFDASGNPVAVSNVPTSAVSVSAFMQTVLDDANAVTARATLIADNPKGTTAARPAFGNAGRLYINTTSNTIQRDSGTAWEEAGTLIPSGTAMVFYQASAPIGWTAVSANDKFLRVVTAGTTGGTTGGSVAASSTLAHTHTTGNFTLTTNEMPAHTHTQIASSGDGIGANNYLNNVVEDTGDGTHGIVSAEVTGSTGGGAAHNHGNTGSTAAASGGFAYADIIICTKD